MEGWKFWRKCLPALIGSVGLLIVATPAEAIFIRGAIPPVIQPNQGPPPPDQQGGGGNDPAPPPPTGGGETPPGSVDPPADVPPQGTPEPASLVTALIGAGLAFGYAWRKRRNKAA